MLMIPLPYVFAVGALFLMWRFVWTANTPNRWLLSFLILLAFQEFLIGTRFGYGFESLVRVQPFTAAFLAPLAYLSYKNPPWSRQLVWHLIPFALVVLSVVFWVEVLDLVLAISNLIYAGRLAIFGLRGSDALPWAAFGDMASFQRLLWVTVALLLFTGLTDVLISIDFARTRGANTLWIASGASLIGLAAAAALFWVLKMKEATDSDATSNGTETDYSDLFQTLTDRLAETQLYTDPDINLKRIARRFSMSTRDVSRAINSQAGENVSQYVNRLRIQEACRLLKGSDQQITPIIYAVGFNSKSNFNREFSRITGQTPTQWRHKAS